MCFRILQLGHYMETTSSSLCYIETNDLRSDSLTRRAVGRYEVKFFLKLDLSTTWLD